MIRRFGTTVVVVFCIVLLGCSSFTESTEGIVRGVTYSPHIADFSCHMNMGPTGAKAWMRGYHLVVASVDHGSPAHGRLQPADVVIAADGTNFGANDDPRITLGNAIGRAEADGIPLELTVLRGKGKRKIRIPLPQIGSFSSTWPADCPKSKYILTQACRSLINAQLPNGRIPTDGNMGTALGGLLLLASGDPAYLDAARRAAYSVANGEYSYASSLNNWNCAYGGLLLSEYYLATGDDAVLATLQKMVDIMCRGQMRCGGWGHTSPGGAYGTLNQVGVVCAITLTLARECGVHVDLKVLKRAHQFFGQFAELGAVPYGDHLPGYRLPDDNGRSATAGILMHLAGNEDLSAAFCDSVSMSYWMREEGHTGGFFSLTWGPLASAMAGREKFQTFMNYQKWFYNLCRTWKGELVMLPYYEALTRFDDSSYAYFGGDFTTGGMALAFAIPLKRLRIMGAPVSIFSRNAKPTGQLLQARNQYLARAWSTFDKTIAAISAESLKGNNERRWFRQLQSARALSKASTERVLIEVESNLASKAPYRASEQYTALKRRLGSDGDRRFTKLDERLSGQSYYIGEGKKFYDKWAEFYGYGIMSWVPQGPQAKRITEALPSLRMPIWEPLSPVSQITPQPWRTFWIDKGKRLPFGWNSTWFDDSAWHPGKGITMTPVQERGRETPKVGIAARRTFLVEDPQGVALRVRLQTVRRSHTKVFLNGNLVVNAVRGQRGGYASIMLEQSALKLLQKGKNVLAVTSDKMDARRNRLDVGLEINRIPVAKQILPIERPQTLIIPESATIDNTLRVRETKDEMAEALLDSYRRKSVQELLLVFDDRVAYRRHLARTAMLDKGIQGIQAAIGVLNHRSWKVRSSACRLLGLAAKKFGKNRQGKEIELIESQIPIINNMLQDQHYWVQVQAASLLAVLGESANVAIPNLLKLVEDDHPWVRLAAINAVQKLNKDPKTAISVAVRALKTPNSAYAVPRQAFAMLKKYPGKDDGRLEALVTMLRNPPQGMGGRMLLKPLLDMMVLLDPEGKVMVPVLADAAADKTGMSRQQNNARGKIIELLGAYGAKARAAVPVLQAILASETKVDKAQHGAAQKALNTITGKTKAAKDAK